MWGQRQPLEPLTAEGVPRRQWSQSPSQEDNRDHVSYVHPREKSQEWQWGVGHRPASVQKTDQCPWWRSVVSGSCESEKVHRQQREGRKPGPQSGETGGGACSRPWARSSRADVE